MGPYYDRKSVTAAYRGNLGLWFRCPGSHDSVLLPLSVPVFAGALFGARHWYRSAASGSLNKAQARYPAFASCVLGTILFVASSFQQWACCIPPPRMPALSPDVYDFRAYFRFDAGYGDGLDYLVGCLVAALGLYLLGVDDQYQMAGGDLLQLAGASIWALHILAIDHFTKYAPGLQLACGQFVVCAALGIFVSLLLVMKRRRLIS